MSSIAEAGRRRPAAKSHGRVSWRVTPRFWALAVTIFFAYAGCIYALDGYRLWSLHREIAAVNRQIAATAAQNAQLEQEIAQHESDAYVERAARQELGMVKKGEIPFIVTNPGQ